jgi:hypothetical protein
VGVLTLGFLAGDRSDVERRSLNEGARLPQEGTVVILLDAAADASGVVYSRRQIDFTQAIKRGARIVFVAGPDWGRGAQTAIIRWLAEHLRFRLWTISSLEIRSRVADLDRWFADQRAHAGIELTSEATEYDDLQVLGTSEQPDGRTIVVSLRYRNGRAEIVFVPLYGLSIDSEDVVLTFLDQLAGASEYPEYLDALDLGDEEALRGELEAIEQRRSEIDEKLVSARRTKQILYFTDMELEREVVRFLREELGVSARHVAGSAEDFRLVDDEGNDWAIGEVKGYGTKNVPRGDLGLVDIHRGDAGFPDDAPALLVGNTFHTRASLDERDEPIPDNVIRRAADDRILVVRTLDLIRLKQLARKGSSRTEEFVEAIQERGGWFEVNAELRVHVHPS